MPQSKRKLPVNRALDHGNFAQNHTQKTGITTMTKTQASTALAELIWDDNKEHNDYDEYIEDGNDPTGHALYWAAVILGKTKYLEKDLKEHKKRKIKL